MHVVPSPTKSIKFILFLFENCYSGKKTLANYQFEDGQKTSIYDDIVPGILALVSTKKQKVI